MARPVTIDDLRGSDLDTDFIDINMEYVTLDTRVGAAVMNLIEACRASEVFNLSEDGEFRVTVPKTRTELENLLRSEQTAWDYRKEAYENLAVKQVESWYRYSVDAWVREEGLPDVDWVAHDKQFEVTA